MKVAVLGGGTAGFMAALHLTKTFPSFDLYHIYDPSIPTIGVGEGTTPDVQHWLHEMTGVDSELLQQRCHMTRKYAIRFENWGPSHPLFMHNFYPVGQEYAYHFAADELVKLLQEYVVAQQISKRVDEIVSDGVSATIVFADDSSLQVDFVFDARGFPPLVEEEHLLQSAIPTNAALIRQGPPTAYQRATRSVARPHGWVFIIPLLHRTAYGYIYNNTINTPADIEEDLAAFLQTEGVPIKGEPRQLTFPNFISRSFFDGTVFKIGNRASFFEPLEATSISFTLTQLRVASRWPLSLMASSGQKPALSEHNIATVNRYLYNYGRRLAFFIGWHYAQGAQWNSPFWHFAQSNFEKAWTEETNQDVREEFQHFWQNALSFPHPVLAPDNFAAAIESLFAAIRDSEMQEQTKLFPRQRNDSKFGLFSTLSFAEVGQGMHYQEVAPSTT
ncbi:MAG: tryptophan 7-halogenase [Ardenticatenales bacterium]|nr:tryptophan 7-halogenase [Ardenticatenales bacterium]